MNRSRGRKAAYRHGQWAELAAALFLIGKFYAIIARNWRSKNGEIDIVARKGNTIVLVEVKARHTQEDAIEAVTYGNRKRIAAAGRDFLARNPHFAQWGWRYDIITVAKGRLTHLRDAWRDGE